ncbi:MAG: sugar phosphate isomerase/epimerase, partial [Thermoguttaceae bacterium]
VGRTGHILGEIYQQVNHPGMLLIFDAANVLVQGFSPADVVQQYLAMKPGLGWMHIKDYCRPNGLSSGEAKPAGPVDEETMKNFVPADVGQGCHEVILRDFSRILPAVERKLRRRGIPGVFLDLEPHLKGGGQFGGFSGPDGMGVAVRSLVRVLDFIGIDYHLRDFADIQAARGF